jgi:MFS transporter, PPP family, 3-phenylpropionic acid transporter
LLIGLASTSRTLAVLVFIAAVIASGYGLPAAFAIFLIVSVAHASALAPIVPIADAMTLAAAPGRFQYGWVRGAASAASVVGAVGAGQVVQATSLGGIVWMNGTMLALAAVAVLRLPRNALDRPVGQRPANVRALFRVPGFMPLMALVLGSHALYDGFEVMRWQEGGIGPGIAGLLWSEGVLAEVVVFVLAGPPLLGWLGPAGAAALAASAGVVRWSVTAVTAWLPAMALVEPLHGLTFALLHLACMQMLSVIVPPALAATAQAIYGTVAVGVMSAILALVSGPLYGAFGARVLGHGAALCRCPADRLRDAQNLDRCIRVEADPADASIVARPPGCFCGHLARFTAESARQSLSQSNKPRPNPVLRLVSPTPRVAR